MAYVVNREHFIPFHIVDINSNPIVGLTLSDFAVIFLRDLVQATEQITINEQGGGFYIATYTPLETGFFYLELYHVASGIRVLDAQEIDSSDGDSSVVTLTQDFGTPGALKPSVANVQSYTLLVYKSSDWNVGNTAPSFAVASTLLDSSGNWLSPQLAVISNTYTVVLKDQTGSTIVFVASLTV